MKHPKDESAHMYSLDITIVEQLMEVHVTGKNTPETILGYFTEIARTAQANGSKRVLVIEDLDGPCLGEMALYKIVRNLNESFTAVVERIALVSLNSEQQPDVFFTETLAQNRGVNVRVFHSAKMATDWLRS